METKTETRILLADDDEDECRLFEEAVSEINGCKMACVNDGMELMKYLSDDHNRPDLIFLDLHMPLKDGIDSLREIKAQRSLMSIPIIIYSVSASDKMVNLSFDLGAALFMRKPDNLTRLKERVEKIVAVNWEKTKSFEKHDFLA